jgi:hypothetical protein
MRPSASAQPRNAADSACGEERDTPADHRSRLNGRPYLSPQFARFTRTWNIPLWSPKKINTQSAPRRESWRGDQQSYGGQIGKIKLAIKTKRATLSKDAIRHVWKRRPFGFKRKGQRGDLHTGPSSGSQPLGAGDDAASQGRQDNDFEAPQVTQSVVLFPLPN